MDELELDHVTKGIYLSISFYSKFFFTFYTNVNIYFSVIGYHPSYLEKFLRIQTFIVQGDGPLPYNYRYYLAIMVSF